MGCCGILKASELKKKYEIETCERVVICGTNMFMINQIETVHSYAQWKQNFSIQESR